MNNPQKRFTVEIIEFDDDFEEDESILSQSRPQPSVSKNFTPITENSKFEPIMENSMEMNEIEEYSDDEYSFTRSQDYSQEVISLPRKITDFSDNRKTTDEILYLVDRNKSIESSTPERQNFKEDTGDDDEREDTATFNPSMFKINEEEEDDDDDDYYNDLNYNFKPFPKITQVTVSPKNEKEMSFEQMQQSKLFRTLSLSKNATKNLGYDVEYSRSISSDFSMTEFEMMQRAFAKINGTYDDNDENQEQKDEKQLENNLRVDVRKAKNQHSQKDPDDELNQRIKQLNDKLTDSLTVTPQNGSRDVSPTPDEQLDLTLL